MDVDMSDETATHAIAKRARTYRLHPTPVSSRCDRIEGCRLASVDDRWFHIRVASDEGTVEYQPEIVGQQH